MRELLALGLLENPLECVVCCLINCLCVASRRQCLRDSGRYLTVPAGEEELTPSTPPHPPHRDVVESRAASDLLEDVPCLCFIGWHGQ